MKNFLVMITLLFLHSAGFAGQSEEEKQKRMQWFEDAKLGIFVQ